MKHLAKLFTAIAILFGIQESTLAEDTPNSPGKKEKNPLWIGYTQLRTDLSGGRHNNVRTSRAMMVHPDGSGTNQVAAKLVENENTWTQFAGWSPDGSWAVINQGWQDPANALWEEEHKTFRMEPGKWRLDSVLWDPLKHTGTNLTSIERVSHYNGGLFFLPGGKQLGFTPLIGGLSKPFLMDPDGKNKKDVSGSGGGFAYGYSASPDGTKISYHDNYQIHIANADGTSKVKIETGNPFNFGPRWSPDGKWLLFLSGKHGASNPFIVRSDGTGLRKLVDLGGYQGWIAFLDVPDFHDGSSDTPVWSTDGLSVFHTAKRENRVELCQTNLEGVTTQLTQSLPGTLHYHPTPSPDGKSIAYGSKRDGVRQLFVRDLKTNQETQITQLKKGEAAMWPHWQPTGK